MPCGAICVRARCTLKPLAPAAAAMLTCPPVARWPHRRRPSVSVSSPEEGSPLHRRGPASAASSPQKAAAGRAVSRTPKRPPPPPPLWLCRSPQWPPPPARRLPARHTAASTAPSAFGRQCGGTPRCRSHLRTARPARRQRPWLCATAATRGGCLEAGHGSARERLAARAEGAFCHRPHRLRPQRVTRRELPSAAGALTRRLSVPRNIPTI